MYCDAMSICMSVITSIHGRLYPYGGQGTIFDLMGAHCKRSPNDQKDCSKYTYYGK